MLAVLKTNTTAIHHCKIKVNLSALLVGTCVKLVTINSINTTPHPILEPCSKTTLIRVKINTIAIQTTQLNSCNFRM